MNSDKDWTWLDEREILSVSELSEVSKLSEAELLQLQAYGPLAALPGTDRFSAHWVPPLRRVARLRADFELDLPAVALLLDQAIRIEALEQELRCLRSRLPGAPN